MSAKDALPKGMEQRRLGRAERPIGPAVTPGTVTPGSSTPPLGGSVVGVPPPVIAVPVKYYKIPPGHAKKMSREDEGGKVCPPGQAKKGRC